LSFNKALEIFFSNENIQIEKGMELELESFLPGELVSKLRDLYSQTLKQGSMFCEYRTTIGNLILWINLNLLSRENKPYAISVFAKDVTDLKKSELALKLSNQWQEAIFEGSLDAIFITDWETNFVAVNKAACELTGYSRDQLLQMKIPDLHDKQDLMELRKYHAKIFQGEKVLAELRLRRKDGTEVFTEFNNSCISVSGEIFMHTAARDISERKLAETAMLKSESRFRSLFDNSLLGISVTNPNGKLLQANQAYARMYGYESLEQLYSEVPNVKVLYSSQSSRNEIITSLCENGLTQEKEVEVIRRDGTRFPVLVSATEVRDSEGNFLYNQATHIDLTERKKIEADFRNASLYSRSLIEASLDPLVTINAEGKITDVNLSMEKITGISRKKLIGSDFDGYFSDREKASDGYKLVFAKGEVKDYPLTIGHKAGRQIEVLFNATLFRNVAGEVQGVLAAARDITDRKRMEVELLNSKELLEKLNHHLQEVREAERSEIALNLHDDLGQRLTAINLDLAWLKNRIGVQSPPVLNKFSEMNKMINDTIDGIKEISSFLRPSILYDLGLVPAIEWQLKRMGKLSGIKCHFNYKPKEFKIDIHISLILFRVLQESLTNIIRHSEAKRVWVSLCKNKNEVEMQIKDNGKGIEDAKVKSITSMGIIGIRERVASVDGTVFIEGKKNKGTIISVLVPTQKKT
jgi:PAS domain S-box-containing protein